MDAIDLGDVQPWLDWLVELVEQQDGGQAREAFWVSIQLTALIARSSGPQTKAQILTILEEGTQKERWAVGALVLPQMEGLNLSDLSPRSIDILKSLLATGHGQDEFRPHVFAQIADEEFVCCELFPLAANDRRTHNAVAVIARLVGKRLGVRLSLPTAQARENEPPRSDQN